MMLNRIRSEMLLLISRLGWRRPLFAIAALAMATVEKHGEQLIEMERLLGPWGIIDSIG